MYDKIFLKWADNVRPFWDPTEWFLYVDSEPMARTPSNGRLPSNRAIESKLSRAHKKSSDSDESDDAKGNRQSSPSAPESAVGEEVERASRARVTARNDNATGAAVTRPATARKSLSPSQLQQLEQYERARRISPAVRYAQKRGDPYTRGYYTVRPTLTYFSQSDLRLSEDSIIKSLLIQPLRSYHIVSCLCFQ